MYAIIFGFDTEILQQTYPTASWNNAYADVRNYLDNPRLQLDPGKCLFRR